MSTVFISIIDLYEICMFLIVDKGNGPRPHPHTPMETKQGDIMGIK
jgi:hypothetical protein